MQPRILALAAAFAVAVGLLVPAAPASASALKPFILASESDTGLSAATADVKARLTGGGFEIVGEHSPYADTTLLIITNDALKAAAAKSEFGGYGAAQRVSLSAVNGKVQVSYTNPRYMAAAYRMDGDLGSIADQLAATLGNGTPYGSEDGMTDDDLRGYHYMFGMEYFDEPSVLVEYDSHQAAIAAVEKGLAAGTGGVTKVFRVDIPGKEEAVFGVAMDGSKGEGTMQDDAYIMSQIDFKDVKSAAHLPYEILVSGNKAYALYARFRIAINFPDLSMMGSNSFMSIMESPKTIERALTRVAGGEVKTSQ